SAGMSHASLPPRRPRLPLPLTWATFASSISSAAFALVLIGVLAPLAALSSGLPATGLAAAGLAAATFLTLASSFARATFLAAGRAARPFSFRRLCACAFFLAARIFLSLLRFLTIRPPVNLPIARQQQNRALYVTAQWLGSAPCSLLYSMTFSLNATRSSLDLRRPRSSSSSCLRRVSSSLPSASVNSIRDSSASNLMSSPYLWARSTISRQGLPWIRSRRTPRDGS